MPDLLATAADHATTEPPPAALWRLATAGVIARALQVVADLAVADHLEGSATAVELADAVGADPGSLDRVLRLLAAVGVFTVDHDRFAHSDTSRLLRSDEPGSMRAFARMMGLPVIRSSVGALELSVRTGVAAIEHVHPGGLWAHLAEHPDDARVFDAAMEAKSAAEVAAVLAAYDLTGATTIADVGGGRGHLLRALIDAAPGAAGILFDLPGVLAALGPAPDRITHCAGDFFVDALPAADAYVLMDVLHDWADADAARILRAVRRAAVPGATLAIIEAVLPADDIDVAGRTLDLIMLTVTGGRERTEPELAELCAGAGFRVRRTIATASAVRVVEAVAV